MGGIFLQQPVSSLPESADADPRNTVWGHTFAGRDRRPLSGGSEADAGGRGVLPVFLTKSTTKNEVDQIPGKPVPIEPGKSPEQARQSHADPRTFSKKPH